MSDQPGQAVGQCVDIAMGNEESITAGVNLFERSTCWSADRYDTTEHRFDDNEGKSFVLAGQHFHV